MANSKHTRLACEELERRFVPGTIPNAGLLGTAGPGLGSASIVASFTTAPNNDNTTGWDKKTFFSHDVTFAHKGYIDIAYHVDTSDGTTEYNFEYHVTNASGETWQSINFMLLFGLGPNAEDPLAGCQLDMDWPDKDPTPFSAGPLSLIQHDPYVIVYGGSPGLLPGAQGTFFFSIDVPDYDPVTMPPDVQHDYGYEFTVRLAPIVAVPLPPPGGAAAAVSLLMSLSSTRSLLGGRSAGDAFADPLFADAGNVRDAKHDALVGGVEFTLPGRTRWTESYANSDHGSMNVALGSADVEETDLTWRLIGKQLASPSEITKWSVPVRKR
jgi:hypothetical protein